MSDKKDINCKNHVDAFDKLHKMRESLCKREKTWRDAFEARDWVVDQIRVLHELSLDEDTSKNQIKVRIEDILCALDALPVSTKINGELCDE
jgi:hypothetical protein